MPYSLNMFDGRVQLIRPLLEISNEELEGYATLRNYTRELKTCPYGNSNRKQMSSLVDHITMHHKSARKNIFRALSNIYPEYLPNYRK